MEITAPSKGKKGVCAACGDSPVAHYPTYLAQSLEAWLADHAHGKRFFRGTRAALRRLGDRMVDGIPRTAHTLRVAGTAHEIERACSYRSQVIWEEARRRGIQMEQLTFLKQPTELYRALIGEKWHYFQSLPIPPALAAHTFSGIDDKARFKRLLAEHGIPVSKAHLVRTLEEAHKVFDLMRKPVVVKPRIGSRARHTTTNIHTPEELDSAFRSAQTLCRDVLIEEHLEGAVSRATVVGGKLVGFLQMFPAKVTGDGVRTITQLVAAKNASRRERVQTIVLDDEHRAFLARSGYAAESVPAAGKLVELSRRTGRFEGGETHEMPATIHPQLRLYIERAAALLHTPIVGFDLIIPDPTADPDAQRWGFLEANSLPYIDLHIAPLLGTPSNVAAAVWDLWAKQDRK